MNTITEIKAQDIVEGQAIESPYGKATVVSTKPMIQNRRKWQEIALHVEDGDFDTTVNYGPQHMVVIYA